jgi:hypothetical protein
MFWLGAAGEPGTETHRGYCPPARDLRDLRDLTAMEAAIYRQAYAEGHAAAMEWRIGTRQPAQMHERGDR